MKIETHELGRNESKTIQCQVIKGKDTVAHVDVDYRDDTVVIMLPFGGQDLVIEVDINNNKVSIEEMEISDLFKENLKIEVNHLEITI